MKTKPTVSLDKKVIDELENEVYKPRQHPGTDKAKVVALPSRIITAIFKSLKGDLFTRFKSEFFIKIIS